MTSYKEAGVDVEAKERTIEEIKKSVRSTFTKDVLGSETTFKYGGVISLKALKDYEEPVLVLSTDGVGTKMEIAAKLGKFDTVGADILNHGINDILTSGAKAAFVLDYIASEKLNPEIIKKIVAGMAKECRKNGIVLAGGETAEMPGTYTKGSWELAATIGGFAERRNIIDGSTINEGDAILGLKSTGLHTNGYSLARKVFEGASYSEKIDELGETLGEALLKTHRAYAKEILPLIEKKLVKGLVHITGGGFPGNIPRVLPKGLSAEIRKCWEVPAIFRLIQERGNVAEDDMYRTFNMGIGMCIITNCKEEVMKQVPEAIEIGRITKGEGVRYAN